MNALQQLSARLDAILSLDESGRVQNPLYEAQARNTGIRRLSGRGRHMRVSLDRVVSTQATVNDKAVNSISLRKASHKPTANYRDGRFILTDGNHHAAAHVRQGRRTIRILVQR